ncbi:glycine cleavage system aminomethyltransferase GcvT [Actinoplanes sp. L3-i22]|uniref:glycine cleavage system aminomethyltransferase GcvT n=1 Tax=Actinoplanes sp. L3-i22 TaxID=2836373 RepID=UPI001C773DA1|nr:glycine cleavage system aminomethyltransferase GcvT [Actinoplanes sp. L3-i22]BCY10674.1 aminomethyltransferase [Actinoplanes sp. L3-i22]
MRRTALFDVHQRHGATFTGFAGWEMPVRYGSDVAEHHAVRKSVGLFDLGHMGQIEVSGPEAAAFLDFALVGRLSAVRVGRAKYTMLCHTTGGVLDDLVVYRLAERRFLVVANAANAQVVRAMLGEHSGGFAVEIAMLDRSLIAVQGPGAAGIVGAHPELPYYAIKNGQVAGRDVLLARTGYTGEDGFEIYCDNADAAGIWAWAVASGANPAGLACRDTLRLEAGMPLYGHELTVRTTPFDAGLGRVVALDKRDFVGAAALREAAAREAAAREAAARDTAAPEAAARDAAGDSSGNDLVGRPEGRDADGGSEFVSSGKELVGLVGKGRRSPRAGYSVVDAVTGVKVGEVTSGAPSPTLGYPIALAYVTKNLDKVALAVDVRGVHEEVEVVPLPFYRRPTAARTADPGAHRSGSGNGNGNNQGNLMNPLHPEV